MNVGHRGMSQSRLEILTDELVLLQKRREVFTRVPARSPRLDNPESEAVRMGFLTHYSSFDATAISTVLMRLRIGTARPNAAGRHRHRVAPSLAIA